MVEVSIVLLKVTVGWTVIATPVAPTVGVNELTVGRAGAATVVKVYGEV
jgi:hypothetical protein